MSNYACFLITVLYEMSVNLRPEYQLLRCALKLNRDKYIQDMFDYPMKYAKEFHSLLPLHVRECGPVVQIDEIFEVEVEK